MMAKSTISNLFLLFLLVFSIPCLAKVWNVGPTRTYTLPSQVASLVADGDIVEIDSAEYVDCASWNANNLTLKGIGGRPRIKNKVCAAKGIWNLNGIFTLIENIEFSGATNFDQNGAGIRGGNGGFTVRNCYFHHNDNGILAFPSGSLALDQSDVLIENCEFYANGIGDGQSHNMYIGDFRNFTLRYSYVHAAKVGHEVKSRALNNYLLYNRISNETSDASRNIDLPNGGNAILIGNVIEQGPNTQNSNLIGYGLEGLSNPAPHQLIMVNNTLVNNRTAGAVFVSLKVGTERLMLVNSIFAGIGTLVSGTPTTLDSARNLVRASVASVGFKNPSTYDYALTASSPALNRGMNPGTFGTFSLAPTEEYAHPAGRRDRLNNGNIDLGSFEYRAEALSLFSETSKPQFVQAFPNPFEHSFSLNLAKTAQKVIVKDLYGREVAQMTQLKEGTIQEIGNDFPRGTYLLSVYFTSGESETSRIVKVK